MRIILLKNTFFLTLFTLISCGNAQQSENIVLPAEQTALQANSIEKQSAPITVGANRTEIYLPLLENKKVGVITNQSGLIFKGYPHTIENSTHLVDSLISMKVDIRKVFSPEHGFRGTKDAGEKVTDGKDPKSGLPIASLHGKNKKPTQEQLEELDILLFDIQDVGVRFYTYISTLTYVMEAAAENGIPVIVLDRPNPNGHYIDGPTLDPAHSSFLGMHPVPLVYGMSIGEYAKMVNGEKWLKDELQCKLTVVPLKNWNYQNAYSLPTRPSPNLPNDISINLYPSLGFFEGTTINAGRGTEMQFQIFGSPHLPKDDFKYSYTPAPNFGSKSPKENGNLCYGKDLRGTAYMSEVNLSWLVEAYRNHKDKATFFKTKSFTLHAGNEQLQKHIEEGKTGDEIRALWQNDLQAFKKKRSQYLMYK